MDYKRHSWKCLLSPVLLAIALGTPLSSSATPTVTLAPSLPSPQPVGTVITWTATAKDTDAGTLMYAFNVGPQGGTLALVRDYTYTNAFQSYPALQEGTYQVQVTVRNNSTGNTKTVTESFVANALASSANKVVIATTANPLVVLFSTVPCAAPESMLVSFKNASQTTPQLTHAKKCNAKSMSFYIAGMQASTQYSMTGVYLSSTGAVLGYTKTVTFTTGSIPSSIPIPTITILSPAPAVAASEPILLHSYSFSPDLSTATDLNGNVIWYYKPPDGIGGYVTRPEIGGYFWYIGNHNVDPYKQPIREVDVAANTVVETNIGRINEQLVAAGQQTIDSCNHELRSLPNGNILLIGSNESLMPGVQNNPDIIGDELIVLNPGLQLLWSWNAFTCGNCPTELPPSRPAILGETCAVGQEGCPPIKLAQIANDWLHGNTAQVATDGSILMSLRHQDWVLKIDYNNGSGTGNILWRLGLDGDFTVVGDPNDTYPWFSHQHDAEWQFAVPVIALFDNGNTRIAQYPTENSRGQAWNINQSTMTATLVDNQDTGVQSVALGTAQMLIDQAGTMTGYHFEAGDLNRTTSSQSQSYYATGALIMSSTSAAYRSAQMHDMYSPYTKP